MPVNIANIVTLTRQRLYTGQPAITETLLYTVPGNTSAKVSEVVATNVTGSPATFSLSAVPVSLTAGVTNRICQSLSVPAFGAAVLDLSVFIDAGDFLSGLVAVAGSITLTISGETYA